MSLKKVISGGQTGADRAALIAAKRRGFQTGGYMPRGFMTSEGPNPALAKEFGLLEHPGGYRERTWANVAMADATLRFAQRWSSPGEICTLNALRHYHKPYRDINLADGPGWDEIAEWLANSRVTVLNVAGNSERTCPGISEFVIDYMIEMLNVLRKRTSCT